MVRTRLEAHGIRVEAQRRRISRKQNHKMGMHVIEYKLYTKENPRREGGGIVVSMAIVVPRLSQH